MGLGIMILSVLLIAVGSALWLIVPILIVPDELLIPKRKPQSPPPGGPGQAPQSARLKEEKTSAPAPQSAPVEPKAP